MSARVDTGALADGRTNSPALVTYTRAHPHTQTHTRTHAHTHSQLGKEVTLADMEEEDPSMHRSLLWIL